MGSFVSLQPHLPDEASIVEGEAKHPIVDLTGGEPQMKLIGELLLGKRYVIATVSKFLDPKSTARFATLNSQIAKVVARSRIWEWHVRRICRITRESEKVERKRLKTEMPLNYWMEEMPLITQVAVRKLTDKEVKTFNHVPSYKNESGEFHTSTTFRNCGVKNKNEEIMGEEVKSDGSSLERKLGGNMSTGLDAESAALAKLEMRESYCVGTVAGFYWKAGTPLGWNWKSFYTALPSHILSRSIAYPRMMEFTMLFSAPCWRTRLQVLCAKIWCVVLFYDDRITAGDAIRRLQTSLQISAYHATWKALRIGNPLFGGNKSHGEVFWYYSATLVYHNCAVLA